MACLFLAQALKCAVLSPYVNGGARSSQGVRLHCSNTQQLDLEPQRVVNTVVGSLRHLMALLDCSDTADVYLEIFAHYDTAL
jgi:hypothetical protein